MYGIPKLLQKLLRKKFGYGGDIGTCTLVALERGLVRSVEDEDRVYREGNES
jgi:hypothetical protein